MPEPSDGEDVSDVSDWRRLDKGDSLLGPPTPDQMPPPLTTTAPLNLNTAELPWETFERLVLAIALNIEGALDVRIYGRPGQAQHGLDVVAHFPDSATTVYQAKRYQQFGANDLRNAVLKYTRDASPPFGASRLVVAVACSTEDTALIDELTSLRAEHSSMTIDLWGRTELSEKLRPERDIVVRFFGRPTADAFCAGHPAVDRPQGVAIDPDAVVRGPVRSLGLGDELRRAEDAASDRPDMAADLFEVVAARLEGTAFGSHAARIRQKQAAALERSGRLESAFAIRLELGWRLLDTPDLWQSQQLLAEMGRTGAELPDGLVRSAYTLDAAVRLRREHSGSLEELVDRFDDLEFGDPHHELAAVTLAEEAIASGATAVVSARREVLIRIADAQPDTASGQAVATRILMCTADSTGAWHELAHHARQRVEPQLFALLQARRARAAAIDLNPELAITYYQDAIERATGAKRYGDAADWLYALRAVQVRFHRWDGDLNEAHRLAQALRTCGLDRAVPMVDPRERALAALLERKWPDALEALLRYRWYSVVTASWQDEISAEELLGDVLRDTGRPLEAVQHYIRAGNGKKARSISLPEAPVSLSHTAVRPAPWERSAAYQFLAGVADLLDDVDAAQWAGAALSEYLSHADAIRLVGGNLAVDALAAFAALAEATSEETASQFLEHAGALVDRAPGQYRFTDDAHIEALLGIAIAHPALRAKAIEQALQMLLVDDRLGRTVLSDGHLLLRTESALVERILAPYAADGHTLACLGLVVVGADSPAVVDHARGRLSLALEERPREDRVVHFGGDFMLDVPLMSVLTPADQAAFVEAMLRTALDTTQPHLNRQQALLAAARLARRLDTEDRRSAFTRGIDFASGAHDDSTGLVGQFSGPPDPLERFQINLGSGSLRGSGLRLAAAAASTGDDYDVVLAAGFSLLHGANEQTVHDVAHALSSLPAGSLSHSADALGAHSSEWIRSLAAVAWAAAETAPGPLGERLARDSSPTVRRALANALRDEPEHRPTRGILLQDPRRSIRRMAARRRGQ